MLFYLFHPKLYNISNRSNFFKLLLSWLLGLSISTQTVQAVQGCIIFYQNDFKYKKALCDSDTSKLTQIPLGLPENLIELRILHQSIPVITKHALSHLANLETLQIESSQVRLIDADAFQGLGALKHLNLRNNSLHLGPTGLPKEAMDRLPNLQSLNLADNAIDLIPNNFFGHLQASRLQNLWLGHVKTNMMRIEPKAFANLPQLRMLDLSFARLQTLPIAVEHSFRMMPDLRELYLGGNPWHCDCKLRWLKHWFTYRAPQGLHYQQSRDEPDEGKVVIQPFCHSPEQVKGKLLSPRTDHESIQLVDFRCIPQIFTKHKNISATLGKSLTLVCEYYADPATFLIWLKDDNMVRNDSRRYILDDNEGSHYYSKLYIPISGASDTGIWSCVLDKHQALFNVTILDLNGQVVTAPDSLTSSKGLFNFGDSPDMRNWIYAAVAVAALFVLLVSIGIGIFYCCEPRTRNGDAFPLIIGKRCSIKSPSCINRCRSDRFKQKSNKEAACHTPPLSTTEASEELLKTPTSEIGNHFGTDAAIRLTQTSSGQGATVGSDPQNNPLKVLCCSNTPAEIQTFTIQNLDSTNQNVTQLGGSLIQETAATGVNRLLVSCDGPEPKLLLATGITHGNTVTPFSFTSLTQTKDSSNKTNKLFSSSADNPISITDSPLKTTYTPRTLPEINLGTPFTFTPPLTISRAVDNRPCPVHGLMPINASNFQQETDESDECCSFNPLPKSSHSSSSYQVQNSSLVPSLVNRTLFDFSINASKMPCANADTLKNQEKLIPVDRSGSSNWSSQTFEGLPRLCPLHGESESKMNLKENGDSFYPIARPNSSHTLAQCHTNQSSFAKDIHLRPNTIRIHCTTSEESETQGSEDEGGEDDHEADDEIIELGTETFISPSGNPTSKHGVEYDYSETDSHVDNSSTDSPTSNSSVDQNFPPVKMSTSSLKRGARGLGRVAFSSNCSSLSNQINGLGSPTSLVYDSRSNSRSESLRRPSLKSYRENSVCPVHSQSNRRSLPASVVFDFNKPSSSLRVTTLPSRFSRPSGQLSCVRKFASQSIRPVHGAGYSTHSLDKLTSRSKVLIKPGSKHKLDTDSENSSEEEDEDYPPR